MYTLFVCIHLIPRKWVRDRKRAWIESKEEPKIFHNGMYSRTLSVYTCRQMQKIIYTYSAYSHHHLLKKTMKFFCLSWLHSFKYAVVAKIITFLVGYVGAGKNRYQRATHKDLHASSACFFDLCSYLYSLAFVLYALLCKEKPLCSASSVWHRGSWLRFASSSPPWKSFLLLLFVILKSAEKYRYHLS